MNIVVNSCIDKTPEGAISIHGQNDYYLNVLSCLDYDKSKPPIADLLRKIHGLEGDWLVVSPIYWQATHNDAMILAAGLGFGLSEEEGRKWFLELQKFVAGEDIKVHYHNPYTWLIQAKNHLTNNSCSLDSLLHKSLMPELEALDDSLYWQRFITESQMFLNNHILNKDKQGQYYINGFWVWGGGSIQSGNKKAIVAYDDEAQNLANILTSDKVCQYLESEKLSSKSVILCSSADILLSLPRNIIKKEVYWYWNNFAYKIQPKNWFRKLFE
jgi:hypothetical protein